MLVCHARFRFTVMPARMKLQLLPKLWKNGALLRASWFCWSMAHFPLVSTLFCWICLGHKSMVCLFKTQPEGALGGRKKILAARYGHWIWLWATWLHFMHSRCCTCNIRTDFFWRTRLDVRWVKAVEWCCWISDGDHKNRLPPTRRETEFLSFPSVTNGSQTLSLLGFSGSIPFNEMFKDEPFE